MRHARDGRASLPRRSRWRNSDGLSGTASQREIGGWALGLLFALSSSDVMVKGSSVLFHAPRPRVCDLASRVRGNTPMVVPRPCVSRRPSLRGTVVRPHSHTPRVRASRPARVRSCAVWSRRLARRAPTNSDGTRRCPTRAAARMADAAMPPTGVAPARAIGAAGARAIPGSRRPGSCDWRLPLPPSRGNVFAFRESRLFLRLSKQCRTTIGAAVLAAVRRPALGLGASIHIRHGYTAQVVSVAPTPLLICTPGPRAPHVIRSVDPERPHSCRPIARLRTTGMRHADPPGPRPRACLHHPRSLHAAERDTRYAAYAPHVCGAPDAHAWTTQETGLRQAAIQAARTCATHTARQYHRSPRPPRKRVQRKGVCTIRKMDRPDAAVGMYCRFAGAAQLRPLRV